MLRKGWHYEKDKTMATLTTSSEEKRKEQPELSRLPSLIFHQASQLAKPKKNPGGKGTWSI